MIQNSASTDRPLIALTGATGFIGRHLLRELSKRGYRIRVLLRRPVDLPPGADGAVVGDLARPSNMTEALRGVDAVVHSAGLAHAMTGLPEEDYRAINVEATLGLARAAERAGAKRFVFLSSVRAQTGPVAQEVLTEANEPHPTDPYGRSKLEAETGLAELLRNSPLDWVALRPVLVYGEGVKGNMAELFRFAQSSWPLPFGGLRAKRSLLHLDNLTAGVDTVLRAPGPLRRAFLIADAEPLSVAEMIAALRAGLGRSPGLLPVPEMLLGIAARLAGRGEAFERLAGSLIADPAALVSLGWQPPVAARAGLAALAGLEHGQSPGS